MRFRTYQPAIVKAMAKASDARRATMKMIGMAKGITGVML
jgi:hypothetical protein